MRTKIGRRQPWRRPAARLGGPAASRPGPSRNARKKSPKVVSAPPPAARTQPPGGPIELPANIGVKELAERLSVSPAQVIKELLAHGFMATINQSLDYEAATAVAKALGFEPRRAAPPMLSEPTGATTEISSLRAPRGQDGRMPKPPVVTVMGHVDHGKTSLLDAIRETNVTASEAGGITQHIGAYQVEFRGHKITFLDTPGHEAFTAMRARGAHATDIVVLVVAADDGVMPQTLEAIDHVRAAKVPILVALNKMDKADANPERVRQQLGEAGLVVEDWGGDIICVPVSAKRKTGIESLLEMILLVADLLDLRTDPQRKAKGVVIEAQLDKTRGPLATLLVQNGTLKAGDYLVIGPIWGKVRAMLNEKGKPVKKAETATPVEVMGLPGVPSAGDTFEVVPSEKAARAAAEANLRQRQEEATAPALTLRLDDLHGQVEAGRIKELNLILKTDVHGSLEPIRSSLERLSNDKIQVKVIHQGTGSINESDVLLAQASNGIIIGFNVRPEVGARRVADAAGIDIRTYEIIYQLVEDVGKALEGLLEPTYTEVIEGHAEVRQLFRVGRDEVVAGCAILDGKLSRSSRVRVRRGNTVIYDGAIVSLRRFKEDVREAVAGYECGVRLQDPPELQAGDTLESYNLVQERTS